MTDFLPYNSVTHPIVRLIDDYNNQLDHQNEKSASYIIRKNGSFYEAIQGGGTSGAGTIAFGGSGNAGSTSGTDASAVIQACIDVLPSPATAPASYGGHIHMKAGLYSYSTPPDFGGKWNVHLTGEGLSTVLCPTTGVNGLNALTNSQWNMIKNLQIYGANIADGASIGINGLFGSTIFERVRITNFGLYGIDLNQGSNVIDKCAIESNAAGLYMERNARDSLITLSTIGANINSELKIIAANINTRQCNIWGGASMTGNYGIIIQGERATFNGCEINDFPKTSIYLDGATGTYFPDNTQIINNPYIVDAGSAADNTYSTILANCSSRGYIEGVQILGNNFRNDTYSNKPTYYINDGNGAIRWLIDDNMFYPAQYRGTSPISVRTDWGALFGTNTGLAGSLSLTSNLPPLVYYPMNEGTGATTIYDYGGNILTGTITGASWVAGKFGTALSFDGTDDNVNCGNNSVLNFTTGDFSIACWVKWVSGLGYILNRGIYNASGYALVIDAGAEIGLRTNQAGSNVVIYSAAVMDTNWKHIVVVRKGTDCFMYVNGAEVTYNGAHIGNVVNPITSTNNLMIGSYDDGTNVFSGIIDDLQIYNYALSATAANSLYVNHALP